MKELHDLELLMTSHTPIIVIESLEEVRVLQLFTRLGLRLGRPMFQWTVTEGMRRLEADFQAQRLTADPPDVLKHIKATAQSGYYVLLDFHPYLADPIHVRLLKEIAQGFEVVPKTLILLSHSVEIPAEIRHLTARFNLQLPDQAGIKRLIKEEASRWQSQHRRALPISPGTIERLVQNLTGVTATDARRLIRNAIENDGALTQADLPALLQTKYQLISQDGVISFEYDTESFADIAGLARLKQWLQQRHHAFTRHYTASDRPKGILLLGIQGGGKSLAAKATAGALGVPLLRIDFAALYNKYIGETEKNLRQALEVAESMAPCVLWMDEIEKGLSLSNTDEGVSQRILGTLLTWMAENNQPVFIVATANDISQLPPELIRKGRLDEIFFVDLPSEPVREEIFQIHLRQRNLAPGGYDLKLLSQESDGFTGAEIEQAIVSAIYSAQAQQSPMQTLHLLDELARTRPLSVVMAEKIQQQRDWADGRAVYAD